MKQKFRTWAFPLALLGVCLFFLYLLSTPRGALCRKETPNGTVKSPYGNCEEDALLPTYKVKGGRIVREDD
jgi:hypothetical protein